MWKGAARISALGCVVAVSGLAFIISGCSDVAHAEQGPRAPEKIYVTTCGYCHGHNVGPIIKGRKLPPQAIEMFVRNGSGAMPAFKPTEITNQELKALAKWISESKANEKEHGK